MQIDNWNDLRYLLAVQRGRSLAAAAQRLGVDATTVSRRLKALQDGVAVPLVERAGDGTLRLTPIGEAAARQAEIMERHAALIDSAAATAPDACAGTVRLTSVPMLVNRLLAPRLAPLFDRHPELRIELIPDSSDLSLTRRESDLALRLARPKTGGTMVKARRVATLAFAAYAAQGCTARGAAALPWIGYDEAMAHLPQARWLAQTARAGARPSALAVRDAETAWEAAAAGLGRTLLPRALADNDRRLRRLAVTGDAPLPARELWLLGHADQMRLPRIAAVTAWIDEILRARARGTRHEARRSR